MATFVAMSGPSTMSNFMLGYPRTNLQPYPTAYPMKMEDPSLVSSENPSIESSNVSGALVPVQRKISRGESIHSGHFMVSEIEENELEKTANKATATESDYEHEEEARLLSHYEMQAQENTQTYVYGYGTGSRASNCVHIDGSLSKLFECMSLAYNGKITSPKWKTFKGLKLQIKDKIRLNNIIWRAWHIQYIAGRNPVVCQFSSSADSKRHKRTEAILLEGKYWKRRVDAVKAEYKKWRMYHRRGAGPQTPSRPSDFDWELSLPRWSNNLSNIDSLFSCEVSADFFPTSYFNAQSSFGNYYDYNSREIAQSGMGAQFMQPGLEQLQPNVDFMDTFEPLHEAISRYHNHNFALPTVQEESTNFETNKEDDLFNSLFPQSNDPKAGPLESDLSKGMLQANSYSSQSMFQASNEMLKLNDANNLLVDQPQQQQQQPTLMEDVYSSVGKIDALPGNYNFSGQVMCPQGNVFDSMSENQAMSLGQTTPAKALGQMGPMGTVYSATDAQHSLSSVPRNELSSSFMARFSATSQVQPQASNQVNIFQPEPGILYGEQDMTSKAAKGKFFPPYYSNSSEKHYINATSSHENVHTKGPNQNRSRSRSISMPHGKSVTIKSLLNKPSLVSTIGAKESMGGPGAGMFRVPNQSDMQHRTSSMERSLSLPIYSQERQRKLGISGQPLFMQRLQGDAPQAATSGNQFDTLVKAPDSNYSFDTPNVNNFYATSSLSATTSPLSSHSSSYSNQDSHLLPQRKISQPSLDCIGKMSDAQFSGLTGMATKGLSFGNPNSNLVPSLLQVNQTSTFSAHASTSSSSSSPIGSWESPKTSVTGSSKTNSPQGPVSFAHSNASSHFGALPKNNNGRFKDQSLEHKRHGKKQLSLFAPSDFGASKEKSLSEDISLSGAYKAGDLSPVASVDSHELSFKHLQSRSISPPTLNSLGLSVKSEYKERRRVCHINAEQKRRCNIKNGFDTLRNLLPSLSSNANTKISKAAMLQKGADYIRILKNDKYEQQKEYEMLKQQVDSLNQTISVFQNQLPATGAPVMGQRSSQIKEQYSDYVHNRTMQNWKFWVFSIIMESLLDSYCTTVATSNFEEMCKTLFRWLDQSCCLITLRRDVLNSLRFISTSTNILTSPESLPEEALLAVTKGPKDDERNRKFSSHL